MLITLAVAKIILRGPKDKNTSQFSWVYPDHISIEVASSYNQGPLPAQDALIYRRVLSSGCKTRLRVGQSWT